MIFQVKLKSGFFRTLNYKLEVEKDELVLKPEVREGTDLIVIRNEDILELGIIRYSSGKMEFEIITTGSYYFGCISSENNIDELFSSLKSTLGKRLSIE